MSLECLDREREEGEGEGERERGRGSGRGRGRGRGRGKEGEGEGKEEGEGEGGSPVPSHPTHSRWKEQTYMIVRLTHFLLQKLEALIVEDLHKFTLEVLIAVPRSSRH